ncbi:MAG: AAA family ATPase [Symploca sp. SIO2E9]|nr:AAA family ATPase [Symploca sp. SIO2E9]
MRIKEIAVRGLFGIFDHVIPLNMNERITIIHGPNGFGKTVMLKMLDGLFNSLRYSVLRTIPFSSFKIEFDNRSVIEIKKKHKSLDNGDQIELFFSQPGSETVSYISEDRKISPDDFIDFPDTLFKEIIPGLQELGTKSWQYFPTKEILYVEGILERFGELLPKKYRKLSNEPEWLENQKNNIHVCLIESQRLINVTPNRYSKFYPGETSTLSTVLTYSDELAELMQDKLTEYGTISQSLDRTFPARVVKQQPSPDLTEEKLSFQLTQLEKTRSHLIELGFLNKDEDSDSQIQPQAMNESIKNVLSVYIEDVETKLSIFSTIASKLESLRKIVNNKFSYKEMSFSKDKGFIFTTSYPPSLKLDNKSLSLTDLSSGEQHELVLLYELLFKVEPNSLVLIDEPELSLHVGWQVKFLEDLREITKLADLDLLMATHSPDIIQDRWDLTVELKGPAQ